MSGNSEEMDAHEFDDEIRKQGKSEDAEMQRILEEQRRLDDEIQKIESSMHNGTTYTFTHDGVMYAGCDFCFMASIVGKEAAKKIHTEQYGESAPVPPAS